MTCMGEPEIGAVSGRVGMYVTCVLYPLGDHLIERLVSFFHHHHYHFSFNADTLGALRDPGLRRKLTVYSTQLEITLLLQGLSTPHVIKY